MNKIKPIIFLIFAGIFGSLSVFAETQTIAGIPKGATAAEFVVYFFNLAIGVGTFIAVVVIAMAGFDYVTAQGEPAKIESAKKKIQNTLLGVAVLLASYLILNIINPSLTTVKINDLSSSKVNIQVPIVEGTGVYLYDSANFLTAGKPLVLTSSKSELFTENFDNKAQSIKFVNAENYKFGAVLFTESNYRSDDDGYCSYILNDVSDLNNASGSENSPSIKNNNLSSIIIFRTTSASASVTFYNNINCEGRSNDYCRKDDKNTPCPEEKEKICAVSGSELQNIKEACPDLKGDVLSMQVNGNAAVLLKSVAKDKGGRCQFFVPANNSCINTIKYSYVYRPEYMLQNIIKPVSFAVFPFVK
jgi:hypothetical protein